MSPFVTWLFSIMAAIMLFLHGLAAFSAEITTLGGAKLRDWLQRVTQKDWQGACFGACATALVQSSSAITAMAVGLAHNKTLSARGALSVMIGANVGTTLTAWLIAFKVTGLGPFFVTIGGLWSLAGPMAWRPYGKPLFYFGIIFLALDLISQALAPLAHHPQHSRISTGSQLPYFCPVICCIFNSDGTVIFGGEWLGCVSRFAANYSCLFSGMDDCRGKCRHHINRLISK
jgi:phosphate:Na+ symporter